MNIALIGDYNKDVVAHQAIPQAIELAKCSHISYQWVHTDAVNINILDQFSGFWCVPASPYSNLNNVLAVIKYARENNVPFLGTCGGYQHAALEFARNVLGYAEAGHAEVNPATAMPLVSSLKCKLYDVNSTILLRPDSFIRSIYNAGNINEEYYCGYGVNTKYLPIYENSEMVFSGFDKGGDPRALEVPKNRYFIGTAYQPERSALKGESHPLITAFLQSISAE